MTDFGTDYPRQRRQRSKGVSVRRDVIGGLIGAALGVYGPDDTANAAIKFAWGAGGAVTGIALLEMLWFVVRFVWMTPREMHEEDQRRIVDLEKELATAKEPKELQVFLRENPAGNDATCRMAVHNHGAADQFVLETGWASPGGYDNTPSTFRWKDTADKRMLIAGGRYAIAELFRVDFENDSTKPQYERVTIKGLKLLTLDGEKDVDVRWLSRGKVIESVYMSGHVVSVLSGRSKDFSLYVNAATDGYRDPQITFVVAER